MKSKGNIPIKVTKSGKNFLFKLSANRVIAGTDERGLSMWKTMDVIVNYFKDNNPHYLELIELEAQDV